jgi:hypothetical protein
MEPLPDERCRIEPAEAGKHFLGYLMPVKSLKFNDDGDFERFSGCTGNRRR